MLADLILQHPTALVGFSAAMVFGATLLLAFPYLASHELSRRLRTQVEGRSLPAMRQPRNKATAAGGLRERQSRSLAQLVAAFRVSDRLNDGTIVNKLQQAGYRGRGAAVKYMAARIICPLALLALAGFYGLTLLPDAPLYLRAAILLGGAAFGWFLPSILLENRIQKRRTEIGRAWPDAVDLMLICVETGMSIEHAFRKVAEEMAATSIELAKEMSLTTAELAYLKERRQAYENLARRVELPGVKAVTTTLIQSERYGTSLGHSLRVLSQESRDMRMAAAEKKAAALPPKLTVPMIIFFLPVLFAVIITPAAIQIMAT